MFFPFHTNPSTGPFTFSVLWAPRGDHCVRLQRGSGNEVFGRLVNYIEEMIKFAAACAAVASRGQKKKKEKLVPQHLGTLLSSGLCDNDQRSV